MAVWSSPTYVNKTPAGTGHGFNQISQHLHAVATLGAGAATGDQVYFGYTPANSVIQSITLKAQSQLDSNGTPTLTIDVGVPGNAQLFMAATAVVGRAAGASFDTTIPAAGKLYKNPSGAQQLVYATIHAAAATPVAGNLELEVTYFVEDTVGSPA